VGVKKSLVSISLVLVLCSTLGAWEADVHYGLTRWLAVNAGFTPAAAELIASADLSADLGSFNPATWAVGFHILILGDVGASKRVQVESSRLDLAAVKCARLDLAAEEASWNDNA
jgi:hypothetical protein